MRQRLSGEGEAGVRGEGEVVLGTARPATKKCWTAVPRRWARVRVWVSVS